MNIKPKSPPTNENHTLSSQQIEIQQQVPASPLSGCSSASKRFPPSTNENSSCSRKGSSWHPVSPRSNKKSKRSKSWITPLSNS